MLTRPFLIAGLSMFLGTLALGMATPGLTTWVAILGGGPAAQGAAFSTFAITELFMTPWIGRVADRYGRKPFYALGLASYVFVAIGWILFQNVTAVIAFRALTGIGSSLIFTMSLSYIGALAPKGQEGRYMGAFAPFVFLGFGIGPLLYGIIRTIGSFELLFGLMGLLCLLSTLIVIFFLPARPQLELAHPSQNGSVKFEQFVPVPWIRIVKDSGMQGIFIARASFAWSISACFAFLPVFLETELGFAAISIGVLIGAQQFVGGGAQPITGRLSDIFPRTALAIIGSIAVAIALATVAITESYPIMLVSFLIFGGLGTAIAQGAVQAEQVTVGRRLGLSTVAGLMELAFAMGILTGGLGGGLLIQTFGMESIFLFSAIVTVFGGFAYTWKSREFTKTPNTTTSS
jgi:DHA1 family multidrug resistance protein-like MFS transporter